MIVRALSILPILISFIQPVAAENHDDRAMKVAGRSTPPIGHFALCKELPRECGPTEWKGPVVLTDEIMAKIVDVNRNVNRKIRLVSDQHLYGVEERWVFPDDAGDVEDFALLKRRELAAKGIAVSNLLLTVALTTGGEGTAVVTVTTDKGDLILDQATDEVKLWSDVPYTFLKRQSHTGSDKWEKLLDVRTAR